MKIKFGSVLLAPVALSALAGDSDPGPGAKEPLDLEPSPKAAKEVIIPEPSRHRWVLGAGVNWRNIGEIDFDTGVTPLTLPMLFGSNSFTPPPGIGAATGFANRNYDDGFVNPDGFTPATGRTTDYGYLNQAQIQGNNLVYTATGGERREVNKTSTPIPTGWSEDRDWELSPYLKLSRLSDLGNGWSVGPSVHLSFTNVEGGRNGLTTLLGREQRDIYDVSAIDAYDATGLVLPAAPYTGAPNIVGPLLPAAPATRAFPETLRQTDVAVWNDTIDESLDLDLWGLALGGEAVYQINTRFYTSVGAGLVLNIVDWDARRRDRLTQQVNNGPPTVIGTSSARASGTDLLWGVYLQAAAGVQVTKQLGVEAHVRYDWNESLSDTVGNSSFEVDLSGFSLGLGGTYSFW